MTPVRRDHLLLLAAQLLCIAIVGHAISPTSGFPLDDAWIHQVIARTFARSGTLGFAPDLHGAAATSFSWAALLAINPLMFDVSPSLFALVVNVPLCIATGQLVLWLLRNDGFSRRHAWIGGAFFSASGNWVWFTFSGMESTLGVFLAVLAIALWRRPTRTWRSDLGAGTACAVLFLTRPEGVFLVAVLGAPVLLKIRSSWRRALLLGTPVVAAVVAYAGTNLLLTGRVSPTTLAGRRWMWLLAEDGVSGVDSALRLLRTWADRLAEYTLGTSSAFVFWPCVGLAAFAVVAIVHERRRNTSLLLAWTLVHLAIYLAILPSEGHGGRYQPLIPPVFAMLVALGVVQLLTTWRAQAVAACALAIPFVWCLFRWSTAHALAVEHINRTEIAMGEHVAALPAGSRIATFDIGGIGYIADRPLTDLAGLIDPDAIEYVARGRAYELLARANIEYLVMPTSYNRSFPDPWNLGALLFLYDNPHVKLTMLAETASPVEIWRPGLNATLHCSPRQFLFKVELQ